MCEDTIPDSTVKCYYQNPYITDDETSCQRTYVQCQDSDPTHQDLFNELQRRSQGIKHFTPITIITGVS